MEAEEIIEKMPRLIAFLKSEKRYPLWQDDIKERMDSETELAELVDILEQTIDDMSPESMKSYSPKTREAYRQLNNQIGQYLLEYRKLKEELNLDGEEVEAYTLEAYEGQELTIGQKICLEKIRRIKEYLNTRELIWPEDRKILENDILIQKNIFHSETIDKTEDLLYKNFDEMEMFERDWKDPSNTDLSADYFLSFDVKRDFSDEESVIPDFMIFGFNVNEDFIPDLNRAENEALRKQLYLLRIYSHSDVVFYVNSKNIYMLRFGSRSDDPKPFPGDTFDEFWDFFNAAVKPCENTTSECSIDLKSFYEDLRPNDDEE